MNKKLIAYMTGIGLDQNEARVYGTLLSLGETTIQHLAELTSISRTSLYGIVERLVGKRLVKKLKVRKSTVLQAQKPDILVRDFKNQLTELESILQTLHIPQPTDNKPRISFLKGAEGFREIWHLLFTSGVTEFTLITDPREMLFFADKHYITNAIIKEKIKRNIKSRQIIVPSEYGKEIIKKDKAEKRETRIMPHPIAIPFTILVFGKRVALISPGLENVIILVESAGFSKTMLSLFDTLWEKLTPHLPSQ